MERAGRGDQSTTRHAIAALAAAGEDAALAFGGTLLKLGLAFIAAIFVASTPAATLGATPSGTIQVSQWKSRCWRGTDEYALNCRASARAGGLKFLLLTGDSQLFLRIEAPGCPALGGRGDQNWWRVDITGMSVRKRRAMIIGAFREGLKAARAACPSLENRRFSFAPPPDIAIWPNDMPRRRKGR